MMKSKLIYLNLALGLVLLLGCSSQDEVIAPVDDDAIIHVGGVGTNDMVLASATTRTGLDDSSLDWLKDSLKAGLDIFYYTTNATEPNPGKLVLHEDNSGITYTLTHNDVPCKWLGNGAHTFLGAYVPKELKDPDTKKDYTDLSHYTAMPPSTKISATISSITIPLQHRLARVQAYVLIDPDMKAKLKGYDTDNTHADNTYLRFCNVDVLDYVDTKGHPIWKNVRKAVPNYLGELGSIVEDNIERCPTFRSYKNKSTGKLLFPTDGEWKDAHKAYEEEKKGEASGYICTDYGQVPSYDLIVRPTYSEALNSANVMPDELEDEKVHNLTDAYTNKIDFELTLDNELEYEKTFTFDLNANEETVVFLRVTPERVDYNSTGSRLWKESSYGDAYYGVNNKNDNVLSKAGSTWQRAFTNDTTMIGSTDGHVYDADTEDAEAQYVSDEKLIELLTYATAGKKHDGKYFILHNDIEIDVKDLPKEFVFTGHLDALDHKITLVDSQNTGRDWLFSGISGGWNAEVLNAKVEGGKLFSTGASIEGHISNCWNGTDRIEDVTPEIPDKK